MKRRSEIFAALAALLLCSIFSLAAQDSAQPGARRRFGLQERPFGMEGGWGARLPGGLMLGKLDLSDAQKEQVNTLVTANHAAVEPYRNQLRDSAKALREATANGQFNEAQIRAIAQTQAQANAELTVANAKLKAEIYNILTPEQRAKVEERRAPMDK